VALEMPATRGQRSRWIIAWASRNVTGYSRGGLRSNVGAAGEAAACARPAVPLLSFHCPIHSP